MEFVFGAVGAGEGGEDFFGWCDGVAWSLFVGGAGWELAAVGSGAGVGVFRRRRGDEGWDGDRFAEGFDEGMATAAVERYLA